MKSNKIQLITATAIMTALLVVVHFATSQFSPFVTGSAVNLILIITVMVYGFWPGLAVAAVSPVLAKFLSVGPLWEIIPCIILGNIILVTLWRLVGSARLGNRFVSYALALVVAAVCKFAVLYYSVVKLMIPLLGLSEGVAGKMSAMFSAQQLVTAGIGGALAIIILPTLKKAMDN